MRKRHAFSILIVIVIGLLISILLEISGIIPQIYPDEIKAWIEQVVSNYPFAYPLIVGGIIVLLIILFILSKIDQPKPPSDPLANAPYPYAADEGSDQDKDVAPRQQVTFQRTKLGTTTQSSLHDFVGRDEEIATVTNLLLHESPPRLRTRLWEGLRPWRRKTRKGPVAVINGIEGVGKTTLGMKVATGETIQQTYADGVYHIAMHGLDSNRAATTSQALREVLQHLPNQPSAETVAHAGEDEEALSTIYTNTLSEQRYLLLLDDPPAEVNLRRFMPPAGSGLLVITRPHHEHLAFPGNPRITVNPFDSTQAVTLLRKYRDMSQETAETICRLCDNLPLAVYAAGKLLQTQHSCDPADYAQQLQDEQARAFARGKGFFARFGKPKIDNVRRDIPTIFHLSYALLSAPQQRLFRSLGIFPATASFDQRAACAVSDLASEDDDCAEHMDTLQQHSLLEPDSDQPDGQPARYVLFDLLRAYAWYELAGQGDDIASLQQRYAAHYAERAEEYDADLDAHLQQFALDMPHIEQGYHVALTSHRQHPTEANTRLLTRYADACCAYLRRHQRSEQALEWCHTAAEAARQQAQRGMVDDGAQTMDTHQTLATGSDADGTVDDEPQTDGTVDDEPQTDGAQTVDTHQTPATGSDTDGTVDDEPQTVDTHQTPATGSDTEQISRQQQEWNDIAAHLCNLQGHIYHEDRQDYTQALAAYEQAINLDPQASYYTNRGGVYAAQEEYDRAIQDYTDAVKHDPQYAPAYFNRGFACYHKGEYDRAIQDYTRAIEIDDQDAAVYTNRGNAWYHKGEYDQAIEDYTDAIKRDNQEAAVYNNRGNAWYHKGAYDQAIQDYTDAIKRDPQDVAAYYNRGGAYAAQERYDQAIQDYTRAIDLDNQDAAAYYNRGFAWDHKRQYDQSIQDYTDAIKLDDQDAAAYTNRGNAYGKQGEHARAIQNFDTTLELNPQDAAAYTNRGAARYYLQQHTNAVADFQQSLQIIATRKGGEYSQQQGQHTRLFLNRKNDSSLAMEANESKDQEVEALAKDLLHKIATGSNDEQARLQARTLLRELGEEGEMIARLTQTIKHAPDDAAAYTSRGMVYLQQQKPGDALVDFKTALKRNPQDATAHYGSGVAYMQREEYGEALIELERATELQPDYADAYFARGKTQLLRGYPQYAIEHFNKVLEISDDPDLQQQARDLQQQARDKFYEIGLAKRAQRHEEA